MPEGPSIVILREALEQFEGKKVLSVSGNAKVDLQRIHCRSIEFILSWGKHLLLCFDDFFVRIHFLMFGSYRINERKETPPRFSLVFRNGEVNFYACSVRMEEGTPLAWYDWETDVMSESWNPAAAVKRLAALPASTVVCDAILNQAIFSGVGNIIKNEVLWRTHVHPKSKINALSVFKLKQLVKDVHDYCLLFYEWKKHFVLKKNWKIYKQRECPRCKLKLFREYMGCIPRLTFYCTNCQKLYP